MTAGIDWLCAAIAALPYGDGLQAVARLESWVSAHLAVQELAGLGSEALATVSAEHTALHYALARRLSTMTEAERKAILSRLRERTKAAELAM